MQNHFSVSVKVPDWLDARQVFSNDEAALITKLKSKTLKRFREEERPPLPTVLIGEKLYYPIVPFLSWFKLFKPSVRIDFVMLKDRPSPLNCESQRACYAGHSLSEIAVMCDLPIKKTKIIFLRYLKKFGLGDGCKITQDQLLDFVYEVLDEQRT